MKLFPDDFAIQMLIAAKEAPSMLFGAILDAIGQNIATGLIEFWDAIFTNEWSAVITLGFMLISTVVFGYRFVKSHLLDSIEYLFLKDS